jgi:thiol-disulfide isomerase/thioredoxin
MKKLFFIGIAVASVHLAMAQAEVSRDKDGVKVVKGFITKKELATDTAFSWFARSQKDYTPDQGALKAMRQNRDSVNFIAFGGTWCHDSQFILPKFFVLADAAGIPEDRITVIGVDRNRESIQHLSEAFHITNVPTVIVMKNGQEVGRVVEYGKHGMFDQELGQILTKADNK